jgi:hypothetical protein
VKKKASKAIGGFMKNKKILNNYCIFFVIVIFLCVISGCENSINWDDPPGYVDFAELDTGLPVVSINTAN